MVEDSRDAGAEAHPPLVGGGIVEEERALHVAVAAYAKAASARERVERYLGAAAAVVSSIVTLSIFASLSGSPSFVAKLVAGILSATAAALVSLEKFSARAPSTVLLRRAGEMAKLWYKIRLEGDSAFAVVCYQHAELIGSEPSVPEKFWDEARQQIASQVPGG